MSEFAPAHAAYDAASSAAAELQQLLLATEDITDFLDELATLTTKVPPGELSCGITMRRGRGATTMASSDTRASQVDEIQYSHNEGPCLHSLATGKVIVVDDLASDDRWGGYQMPALGHGVRSSLSLPLHTDSHVIGALNIYATQPRTFGPTEQLVAGRFADEASRALTLAVRIAERTEMSEHLQSALASRAVIDQALGIIMGQNRCTADEAFEVLRTASQNRNVTCPRPRWHGPWTNAESTTPGDDLAEPTAAIGRGEPLEFVHRIWPAHPRHLAPIRAEVRRWLVPLALAGDAEDDLVLAVSEAASNCIEHAYRPATDQDTIEVTFWSEPQALCVDIVDHGVWQTPSDEPTGRGRGIQIMQRLVAFVLIHHDTHGTRVFLRHPLSGDPRTATAVPDGG